MKPCQMYLRDHYCGNPDTLPFINGAYCRLHTPSVMRGDPPMPIEVWGERQRKTQESATMRAERRTAELKARARLTDPDTSHAAAASVSGITATHRRIVTLLEMYGALTDEEIAARYEREARPLGWPPVSPSGLRTRRAELVDLGTIRDSGQTRVTVSGRRTTVWIL